MLLAISISAQSDARPRARDLGLSIGMFPPGRENSITDVSGVLVGQTTIIRGENIRTGITAIVPHGGNLFSEKVPAAIFVGNGFGKLTGSTQVNELGEIETPIILTSTLSAPKVADFLIDYMLALPGNENVRSVNPVVAETNDGILNDIRSRPIAREDVFAAIRNARPGCRRKDRSAPGRVRSHSDGKAESGRHLVNFPQCLAVSLSASSFNRILAAY